MDGMNKLFSSPGGIFFMLGVSLFAIGLASGGRTLWILGLCLIAFGLLSGAERSGRK